MSKYTSANQRLLHAIYQTSEIEIQCDAAQELIARCADVLMPEAELPREYPQLSQHLQVCADCAAVYALTLELAGREAANELSSPVSIPPVPTLELEHSFWERAVQVLRVAFPGFASAAWTAVRSGGPLPAEPARVVVGEATLELDIMTNTDDPTTRDLLLTFDAADAEGMPLAIQEGDITGLVVQEHTCNARGEVAFNGLAPGNYIMRMLWRGCEYRVQDILVP